MLLFYDNGISFYYFYYLFDIQWSFCSLECIFLFGDKILKNNNFSFEKKDNKKYCIFADKYVILLTEFVCSNVRSFSLCK